MKPSSLAAGIAALREPLTNRGTAFAERDREQLCLTGLLPSRVESLAAQAAAANTAVDTRRWIYPNTVETK